MTERSPKKTLVNRSGARRPSATAASSPSGEGESYVALVAELKQRIADARLAQPFRSIASWCFYTGGSGEIFSPVRRAKVGALRSLIGWPPISGGPFRR